MSLDIPTSAKLNAPAPPDGEHSNMSVVHYFDPSGGWRSCVRESFPDVAQYAPHTPLTARWLDEWLGIAEDEPEDREERDPEWFRYEVVLPPAKRQRGSFD